MKHENKNKAERKPFKTLKRLNSLNLTLWKYFCFFALFIILLMGLFCYIIVQSSFSSMMQDKVRTVGSAVGEYLESNSEPVISASSYREISEYVEKQSFENNVNIAVITQEGQFILPDELSISESEREYWSGIESEVSSRLSDVLNRSVIYSSGNTYTYAMTTSFAAVSSPNYLVVRYSADFVTGTLGTVQLSMIIVGIFAIIIAFLVAYSMAQKISDPLKSLTSTANRMAKGDYNVKFASTEYEEIAQLSDTLNYACDEIKKTDNFQKELLANVSHDLKTPLTMIKAYASMIKEISGDNPEKRNQHLQVIIDEADRLAGLVNDVLNMSKISSDMNQINKKVFNLTEFLYSIMTKFEYLRDMQGYTFMIDIDSDLYTLADEGKIGQVLYNLISNAVNYTGADKTVYVSLKHEDSGRIKFSVRDTGKGIAKDELPSIWNRYYRTKETHARPVKGTGLGLPIVKTILEKHAFDFGVESEVGKGSEFWVDFPEVPAEVPAETHDDGKGDK